MSKPRFFRKTFDLSEVFTRSQQNGHHWAGSTVRACKVISTNNEGFQLDFVPDPYEGHIQGIPLGEIRTHNLETIAQNAVFENHVAQPGVKVTVLFTTEDKLDGSQKPDQASLFIQSEGTSYTMVRKNSSDLVSELIPANDNRAMGSLQHKSGSPVWVGKPADLADADFKNICYEIKSGEIFEWRNNGSLSGKCDTGMTAVFSLTEELK